MQPTRHFFQIGSRRVHGWCAGAGRPVVLIHSSPANARLVHREMAYLADRHCVFAFDTPGFGLSDPLPGDSLSVADLADALAETLRTIGIPRCPVYGTHTGAAIALELGVRHPDRVSALVLDGVPMFTAEEIRDFFGDYFHPMPVTAHGGVYSEVWTRFRDQSVWFPWNRRLAANLNDYDLGNANSTQLWTMMYFEAADSYIPAYRAALGYGPRAAEAVRELQLPCLFTATDSDMLHPHLARLPPLRADQHIRAIGRSQTAKYALIAEAAQRHAATAEAPRSEDRGLATGPGIRRDFVATGAGQIHLRHAGDLAGPRVVLIVHDVPGASGMAEPLLEQLAPMVLALAPDVPGHGETAAMAGAGIAEWASAMAGLARQIAAGRSIDIVGIGFGSALATRLAIDLGAAATRLILAGAVLPDAYERAEWHQRLAPPVVIERDGSHWYRAWLMVRDWQVWWPWYRPTREAQRHRDLDLSPRDLHARVLDIMRQPATWGDLARAAVLHDLAGDLSRLTVPVELIGGGPGSFADHDARLRAVVPLAGHGTLAPGQHWAEAVAQALVGLR